MNKSLKKRLIVCFVGVILTLCFHHFISNKIEFITYSNGNLRIQDYAYYIIIAKAFWFDGFGNIYKLTFQQQALSAYVGSHIYTVMPLGISPIALVVWLPFAYVANFSMALSYTLWVTFSLGILFTALWRVGRYVFQVKKLELLPITLSFVTIFSVTMGITLILGQTSPLAAGLLIHLIYFVHKTGNKLKSGIWVPILFIIFLLAIKPTYLALGLGLLIIYGMWLQTIYSVVIVIFVLICVTPILTTDWILSYLHQLSTFSRKVVPDAYAWAFAPHTMNIFRSAFRNIIGDKFASLISTIVTCSVYMTVVGFSILAEIRGKSADMLSPLRGKSADMLSPLRVTKGQLFVVIIGSYLLFAPYAGGYEDILLLPIFVMVLLIGDTPNLINYKSLVLIVVLFLILTLPLPKPFWLSWILKVLILGYMLNFCRFPSKKEKRTAFDSN